MDISPDKQNIDRVFSNTTYYIDFYQRDYRWDAAPVQRLLDDVFFKFRDQYEESKDLDPGKETITAKYPWYYLNTYVTNIVDGRVYVVDGQQRLTTLSLILMKLRLMAIKWDSQLKAFDDQLTATIAARRNVTEAEPFSYVAFKQTGINLNTRFKRFFFARIDLFLAENLHVNPKHEIADLVTKTGAKTGFHVEHILSYNEENLELFDDDEERFEQERNRLGGILLLKGKDNISSGNEPYSQKLKSYANTLYWNETLRRDSYKSKLDMVSLKRQHNLKLEPLDHFGPNELEQRHRLLYEISRIIWK